MFYGFGLLRLVIFLFLSTRWREIMIYWSKKEQPFLDLPYTQIRGFTLALKIRLIGILFVILFLTEHLLFQVLMETINQNQMKICNVTTMTALNNFMRIVRPHLLEVLPYHWTLFVIFQWLISSLSFGWNFVDYFLIIISLGISTRFTQINERLKRAQLHEMNHKFWLDTRIHYTNLVDLLQFIDQKIAPLILLCMTQNLFLVCTKVFEAIRLFKLNFKISN
jgi:gustatory receptor